MPCSDDDRSAVVLSDLPQVVDIDVTRDLRSSLQSEAVYNFEGEDINIAEYKMACLRHIEKQPLVFLEPNFTEIIALSHCILLKHGCYSDTLMDHFDIEKLERLHESLKARYFKGISHEWSSKLMQKLDSILRNLSTTNEETIYSQVEDCKQLAETHFDKQLVKMVLELLEFLPKYPSANTNEENLRVKFFEPAFKYFLNNKTLSIVLTYSESSPDERKLRTDTTKRPDSINSFHQQAKTIHSGAFFEIKNESYKNRKRILMMDLLKLVHYGNLYQDALDTGVKTPILAQMIGLNITFYLMKLESKGVYIMFEVCHLKLPWTIFGIRPYLQEMEKMQKLVNILNANKEKEPMEKVNMKKMDSYGTPNVEQMVEKLTYKNGTDCSKRGVEKSR